MNDSLKHKIFTETDCLSEQTMFDYIDKKLSARENHSVEKHLLHCELCSDALEGLELTTNSRERIAAINQKIREYIAEPKKETGIISFNYKLIVSIAASVLLLIGGIFFFNQFSQKDEMAEFKSENTVPFPPPPPPPAPSRDDKMLSDSTRSNSIEVAEELNTLEKNVKSPSDKMEESEQQVNAEGQGSKTDSRTSISNGEKEPGSISTAYNPIVKAEENKQGTSAGAVKSDNNTPKSESLERAKDDNFAELKNADQAGAAPDEESPELTESTVTKAKLASAPGTGDRDDIGGDKMAKKSEKTNNLFRSEALEKRRAEKDTEEQPAKSIAYAPQSIIVGDEKIETTAISDSEPNQLQDESKSIDHMPEFPGGQDSLLSFISKNFKYPANFKTESIRNKKIYVNFIVDEVGRIKKAKIIKGINSELDKEALRVVNSMPKWKAGINNGKSVSVNYNLPISLE